MRRKSVLCNIAANVTQESNVLSSTRSFSTRRHFLNRLGFFSLMSCFPFSRLVFCSGAPVLASSPALPVTIPVVKNRAPLAPSVFHFLSLGSVRPSGWLKAQLRTQSDGLSGHLDETWADVGPDSGWLGGKGESWERGPYYLDGLVPLAYLLNDARLKAKAQRYIDWTLDHQAPSGMIGPSTNDDWWPRFVILKALTQYQEFTGDSRVIPLMDKYLRYQLSQLPQKPLRDWSKFRWQDELLSVIWLYNRTGSSYLLELAQLLRKQGYDWMAQFADFRYTQRITAEYIKLEKGEGLKDQALATHGVNNGQAIKTGPVWSQVSGSGADRDAVLRMISELNKYHGLPNGMFSCDEHLAGLDPSQGSELCTVVEYMFSLEHSLAIVGDPSLGDRLEQLAFNALPGTFTDDMWAHQYNQEPNQVECSLHRKPWTTDGPESNLYGLEPNFGCCTANFHQGWPKFTSSLWMASEDDGLVAAAYSPCNVLTSIGRTAVELTEVTDYPFRGTVRITVNPAAPISFSLSLSIPAWADGSTIHVNGEAQPTPASAAFAKVDRTWKQGDVVELQFPLTPRLVKGYKDSVSIDRGALVFSYPIGESWVKLRDRGMTADWQVFPTTQWNYALAADTEIATAIPAQEIPVGSSLFTLKGTPVKLQVNARKLTNWRSLDGVAEVVPQSPVRSDELEEKISLVPYAAAKLRITAFPQLERPPKVQKRKA